MDENLDSTSRDQKPNIHSDADQKRIDSIPLWLQGISENAAASPEPDDGEWQKEQTFVANQETGPTLIEITEIDSEEDSGSEPTMVEESFPEETKAPLPNWIEENVENDDDDRTMDISLRHPYDSGDEFDEITEEIVVEENHKPAIVEPLENEFVRPAQPLADSDFAPWEKAAHATSQNEIGAEIADAVPPAENAELAPWEKASEIIPPEEIEPEISETSQIDSDTDHAPWEQASGFVRIEDIEADIAEEIEEPANDEVLAENEEIPDWLREMIAADEKQQKEADEIRRLSRSDEPTQPIVVSSLSDRIEQPPANDTVKEPGADPSEIESEEIHHDEISRPAVMPTARLSRLFGEPVQEDAPADEPEEPELPNLNDLDPKLERDFSADFDGSGFQPIQFDPPVIDEQNASEDVDDNEGEPPQSEMPNAPTEFVLEDWRTEIPSQEEEAVASIEPFEVPEPPEHLPEMESEQILNGEIPSSLIEAKQVLEQGEVKEALIVIKSYINQSQYLDEIKDWLLTANTKFEKNKAGLWEALGDISSHQGDYSSALSSYAKAIEFL
ncbi:MAG: hypothetical protein H0S82_06030, partial [Anaerolineaceae bacterium]|nr:hypothetical protein [Anaerolineaceae bacterium]